MNSRVNCRYAAVLLTGALTFPSWGQTVSEGVDHATTVLHNAWDMSSPNDVFPLLWTHNLASATVSGGVMTGTARDTDPHFWLQFPRIPSAIEALNLKQTPIDANRFNKLSLMMWLPETVIAGSKNGRLVWHSGGDTVAAFDAAYSESPLFPVYPGWHLYQFNLSTLAPLRGTPWSGSIHGLRVDPCLGCNVTFKIDWARLYNDSENASQFDIAPGKTHVLAEALPTGSGVGATTALPAQNGKVSAARLPPGNYRVASITEGDYALSQRGRAWSLDTTADFLWASNSGISGASVSSNGLSGTTSGSDPFFLLDVPPGAPIDASKYRHIAIDMTLNTVPAQESGLLVWWGDQAATVSSPSSFVPVRAGRATYRVDLGQSTNWRGLIRALRIDPLNGPNAGSNVSFTVHSVRLTQASGFEESVAFNTTPLTVNARPRVTITSPGFEDGDDYALVEQGSAWTMKPGQAKQPQLSNLLSSSYVSSIPELNLAGQFFKGTSQPAAPGQTEGDPHVFLAFQENASPIDASYYRWMGFDLYVPMNEADQGELTRGAVARLSWKSDDVDPGLTSDDIVLQPGLRRYWFDMSKLVYEPISSRVWGGMVRYLRVDPFEFPESRTFYAGQAQLRSSPSARYVLPVNLRLEDADGDKMSVVIRSGATVLASAGNLSTGDHQIFANVAALAAGEHTLSVEISDGVNAISRSADIPMVKLPGGSPLAAAQIKAADRVFNWAERILASTLGAGSSSGTAHACLQSIPGAYGRYYPTSGICLFSIDGLVVFTVANGPLQLAGTLNQLLSQTTQ